MKQSLIRYKTKPERAEKNERLIKDVFDELHAKSPEGLRYMAVKLGDASFVHLVAMATSDGSNPLATPNAFWSFQKGIRERCVELSKSEAAIVAGNYRMLDDR